MQKYIVLKTQTFLDNLTAEAKAFKANNGFGRWLAEYVDMDKKGLFEAKALKIQYIRILNNTFDLGFIRKQAVYCIGIDAFDATETFLSSSLFCLRYMSDKSIYKDEDGDALTELDFIEAFDICEAINDEFLDQVVYISEMTSDKLVYTSY